MRGAISLAAALAVPASVAARPEILLLTFGVIVVTLVGQGLTLPLLLRALRLPGENPWSPDEAIARLETAQAALDRLDELEDEGGGGGASCGACASSTARASRSASPCSAGPPATATGPSAPLRRLRRRCGAS